MGRFLVEYLHHQQYGLDPIARLLEFTRKVEHACTQLRSHMSGEWAEARSFFEREIGAYRRDLEQAVFPILKARVREEEQQEEDPELVGTLMRVSGELVEIEERWRELKPLLERQSVVRAPIDTTITQHIATFVRLWEEHVSQMEHEIIPALHALLSEDDLKQLGKALARHSGIAWSYETQAEP
jgi:hypothetical protein